VKAARGNLQPGPVLRSKSSVIAPPESLKSYPVNGYRGPAGRCHHRERDDASLQDETVHPKEQESARPVPRATRNQASRNNEESAEQGELEQPADESFDYQHMNTSFSLLGDSVA